MLQNNLYTITTVDYSTELPTKGITTEKLYESKSYEQQYINYDNATMTHENEYKTSVASNMDNVFSVSDSDAREDALVEYEYKKSKIDAKESKIDERLKNLTTEQSAIGEMLKGIETVMSDNTGRTFNLFTSA